VYWSNTPNYSLLTTGCIGQTPLYSHKASVYNGLYVALFLHIPCNIYTFYNYHVTLHIVFVNIQNLFFNI